MLANVVAKLPPCKAVQLQRVSQCAAPVCQKQRPPSFWAVEELINNSLDLHSVRLHFVD